MLVEIRKPNDEIIIHKFQKDKIIWVEVKNDNIENMQKTYDYVNSLFQDKGYSILVTDSDISKITIIDGTIDKSNDNKICVGELCTKYTQESLENQEEILSDQKMN